MPGVPRRLPLSSEERLNVVTGHMSPGSAAGNSRFAKPVEGGSAGTRAVSRDPSAVPYDRLAVGWHPDLGGTPPFYCPAWDFVEESDGAAVGLNPAGDDGGIYLFQPGVFAVNVFLKPTGIGAAAATCEIRAYVDVTDPFATGFDCFARGGAATGRSVLSSTSRTYYDPGNGTSGGLYVGANWVNLDPAVTDVVIEVQVMRIS